MHFRPTQPLSPIFHPSFATHMPIKRAIFVHLTSQLKNIISLYPNWGTYIAKERKKKEREKAKKKKKKKKFLWVFSSKFQQEMSRRQDFFMPKCHCGRSSRLGTSWTIRNPSRRYFIYYKDEVGGSERCNFFQWFDPKMCKRSIEVIPGLLRWIPTMEVTLKLQVMK